MGATLGAVATTRTVPGNRDGGRLRQLVGRERSACKGPGPGKRPLNVRNSRTFNFDSGVPPAIETWLADPVTADAQTRNVADTAVDGEHLTVVTIDPAERAVKAWWIETPDFHSGAAKATKVTI